VPPWLEEAVDSSEVESRSFPIASNVKKDGCECLFRSRHYSPCFVNFGFVDVDGHACRQPSEIFQNTVHNRTNTCDENRYDLVRIRWNIGGHVPFGVASHGSAGVHLHFGCWEAALAAKLQTGASLRSPRKE